MTLTTTKNEVNNLIEMIGAMARLDFSQRLKTKMSNEPMDILAHGLNMLSEELEQKVSEKKRLEEINENLERFSFTVAHDLKSPILASNGLIDLMQDEIETNGEIPISSLNEYLGILKEANTQISKLINGILQYSRLENDRMDITKVRLFELIWDVTKDYKVNENIRIEYPSDLPVVYHNETALNQVLRNLINNAIKYCDKEQCHIQITHQEDSEFHTISVIDNGPGIRNEEKDVIFNLFENLRNVAYESTGVGLAIVEKIVSKSNGKVWVEDVEPTGAKFSFTIPKTSH